MKSPTILRKISSQQPYYTEQTIYNHERRYVHESSTPSFLKDSISGTPHKINLEEELQYDQVNSTQLVQELATITDRIHNICLNRGDLLRQQIDKRKKIEKSIKVKTIKLKDLIVQDTQNKCEFKSKPDITQENKDDYRNFQMDENLNYIQNLTSDHQPISTIAIESKDNWLTSEEYGSKEYSRQNSTVRVKGEETGTNSTKRKRVEKKDKKSWHESEKPKGVYEQILSLYSTAKLIALKQQFN